MTNDPHMFYSGRLAPESPVLRTDSMLLEAAMLLDPRLIPAPETPSK